MNLKTHNLTYRNESIFETTDGVLWIGDYGKILKFESGKWSVYGAPDLTLPNANIRIMGSQHHPFLWILGTVTDALYLVDRSFGLWKTYQGLNLGCEAENGDLWFLTPEGQVVRQRDPSPGNEAEEWEQFDISDGLIDTPVDLFASQDGQIWAVGSHGGKAATARFDGVRWNRKIHPNLNWGIGQNSVCQLRNGSVLFGSGTETSGFSGGMAKWNSESNRWEYFKTDTIPPFDTNPVFGLARTTDGRIWHGGLNLTRFDGQDWQRVLDRPELTTPWIDFVTAGPNGELWVSKGGQGLYRFDGLTWTRYSVEDGLASNMVSSLLCQDQTVWAATDRGISRFDGTGWKRLALPGRLQIDRENGMLRVSGDGSLWINMSQRDWYKRAFYRKQFSVTSLPQFRTIRYRQDGAPPETDILFALSKVSSLGNVYVSWTGVDAWNRTARDALEFAYRLDGENWSKFGPLTSNLFLSLQSGDHIFEVKSRDGDFNEDPTPARVQFMVMPPVWKEPWFILLMSALFLIIVFFQYRVLKRDEKLKKANIEISEKARALEMLNQEIETASIEVNQTAQALKQSKDELERLNEALNISNSALLTSNEELEQFAYAASHDLKEPLRTISGYLSLISKKYHTVLDEDGKEFLGFTLDGVKRMNQLIDDLLEYSRVSSKTKKEFQAVDLTEVGKIAENTLMGIIDQKGAKVTIQPLPTIQGDKDQLIRLFQNLITNAIKYNESERPEVVVEAEEESDGWIVKVRDNGIGINPDFFEKIFQVFQRLHGRSEYPGTGVGLAVCRKIVLKHGGRIWVESEEKKGSTFKIKFNL